mmetsp:Transcript_22436/g.29080  ORF Transcript_22436/g.29080 Transcript_22436/m.29080 type:complete len:924 (+) Transcript_22436:10-2781(+)
MIEKSKEELAERNVRKAGLAIFELVENLKKAWSTKKVLNRTIEIEKEDDAWPEVKILLDAVDAFTTALEHAARLDAKNEKKTTNAEPPLELASLREMAAVHTALEISSGWGVALVCDSRCVVRDWSRIAKLPRSLMLRYRHERTEPDSLRQQRLFYTFRKACSAQALAPLTPRFSTEMVALALELGGDFANLHQVSAHWCARAARELFQVRNITKTTRIHLAKLLSDTARRDVYAILNEFCGDDELAAETGGDAPAVQRNIANALAAIDPRDDVGYVAQVAHQLAKIAAERDDDPPRANAARAALARFGDIRTEENPARQVLLDTVFGPIFAIETRPKWWRDLLTREDIALATSLYSDSLVVKYWHLATFFHSSLDLNAATGAIAAFATVHTERVAKALNVVWENECALERLEEILTAIDSPALAGALFAQLIETHLEGNTSFGKLRAAAKVAQMLDAGALETSGIAILRAVAAVLNARVQSISSELSMKKNEDHKVSDDDNDLSLLEQVSLGTLLAILQLGSTQREENEERVLRGMLSALEILSSPARLNDQGCAGLAADCRVLIITRKIDTKSPQIDTDSWISALDSARRALRDSELPSERARAIVIVTRFARTVARRREESHKVSIIQVERTESEPLPKADDWKPVAEACIEALADSESYVYLAATHSLVALADAHPIALLAFFAECLDDEDLSKFPIKNNVQKAQIAQARLTEALSHAIRRRGDAAPAYVKLLALRLVIAARPYNSLQDPNDSRARCAAFSALADLAAQAKYAISSFLLDIIDLVSATLDREPTPSLQDIEDEHEKKYAITFVPRRAAAFLGRRLIEGNARAAMLSQPRPLAIMCKKLRRVSLDLYDDASTRHHALLAMAALDNCLREVTTPDPDLNHQDTLPMNDPNWLVNAHPNQFDFVQEIGPSSI